MSLGEKHMKIAIITDSIEKGPTSVGKYTENLVRNLLKINEDKRFKIILIHGERKNLDIYTNKTQEIIFSFFKRRKHAFFLVRVLYLVMGVIYNLIRTAKVIRFCQKEKVHALHIPHLGRPSPPIILSLDLSKNFSLIFTNHGMANLALSPKKCYGKSFIIPRIIDYINYLQWKYFFRNRFEVMITVSHSEKKNISRNLNIPPDKIEVVYHGADYKNCKSKRTQEIKNLLYQNYGINFPFIFHLSAYQPKKNVEAIIKAFAIIKKKYKIEHKLIIGGKQPEHLKRLAKDLRNDIIFIGFIPEEDLPLFYGVAEVFVFPSFHESFGMPIVEAMACGCPVITSNVFSMPEVAGKAAVLVDPHNIEEIAEAMYKVMTDKKLQRKLAKWGMERAKKFTWEKCAKEHLKCYVNVMLRDDI